MDTNALLRKHNYHLRSDFGHIAKYAAQVNDLAEEVVINLVSSMNYQNGVTVDIIAKMEPKVVIMGGA